MAVKKLIADDSASILKSFRREINVLHQLSHDKHIVQFFGKCLDQGNTMLVLEYMEVRHRGTTNVALCHLQKQDRASILYCCITCLLWRGAAPTDELSGSSVSIFGGWSAEQLQMLNHNITLKCMLVLWHHLKLFRSLNANIYINTCH